MNRHIELAVNINPLAVELASDCLLIDLNCSGVVMQEAEYKDEEIIKEIKNSVKGYMWVNPEKPFNKQEIQDLLWKKRAELINHGISEVNLGSWNLETTVVEDEEWAHNWKKYWHPMKIGNKIIICPSWENYDCEYSEIKIDLDPGSAFGTGTHSTTRLCVQALEKHLKQGDKLADVGTGSGILAIVGIKLGAEHAVGVDNDLSVIHVAIENSEKNNVSNQTNFYEGSASDIKGEYEVVSANILAHILIEIMGDLKKLVKQGGKLILSGIIEEKAEDVILCAQSYGLNHVETLNENNWVAIVVAG